MTFFVKKLAFGRDEYCLFSYLIYSNNTRIHQRSVSISGMRLKAMRIGA
jgi:hypothetical protein